MFGKKGFIRTVEAVIAIVLLLSLILFVFSGDNEILNRTPEAVKDANSHIINEFLHNNTFRNCFSNTEEGNCNDRLMSVIGTSENRNCKDIVTDFISKSLPSGYSSACEVCKTSKSCANLNIPQDKSVYPKSGFIYSEAKKEGRIIRVYIF